MPFGKSVLFVAPATDLHYASKETEEIVNLLHANLLNGRVEIGDLIERVRKVQPALLIISAHGNQDGILLSDGPVGADLLKPILGTANVECIYLNTCESLATAMAIHNELPTAFISTIEPIPDKTAYVTMTAFAHHLDQGCSYVDAWFQSKAAGNRTLLFLPALEGEHKRQDGKADMSRAPEYMHPSPRNSNGEIEDIHEEVDRLSALVYGSERWNSPGILPTLTRLERDINQVRILLILVLIFMLLLATAVLGRGWPF